MNVTSWVRNEAEGRVALGELRKEVWRVPEQ